MSLNAKKSSESEVEIPHLVMPGDANPTGYTFGGRVMEWIDVAAGIVANRHSRRICVTVSMDELHFIAPVKVGNIIVIKARVNYTHKTSMEIGVKVEAENPFSGDRVHTASSYLTFVGINDSGKPTAIPALIPEGAEQERRFNEARARRKHRLAVRAGKEDA